MELAVAYYRVSTKRQGESGLGLSAQQAAIEGFIKQHDYTLCTEFVEVESGKNNKRPILQDALAACRKHKATLLIAKLDRLGRNVAFISALMESGVEFKAVDNPYAGKLLVHIMAAIAEHERDRISERTREALQIAKARGTVLGTYGRDVLSKRNKAQALQFAQSMKPTLDKLHKRGITSMRKIASELNRKKIPSATGKKWYANTVHVLLKRLRAEN